MNTLEKIRRGSSFGNAESLANFGFRQEKISSYEDFCLQMESHALHVVEDRPISNAYTYFIDRDEIYTDKERRSKLFVDPKERGGFSLFGTKEAIKKSLSNLGQIVFLYSPPGQVAFEKGTDYDNFKPYPDGQLYLMVAQNSTQIDAMAISVSKEQEKKVLSTFFGKENMNYSGFDDEIAEIKYFLSHPVLKKNFDIDGLLTYLEGISYLNDFLVYKNVHNKKFFLSDLLLNIKRGWMKEIKPEIEIDYHRLFEMAKRDGSQQAYLSQMEQYFPIYAQNGKMPLGGGCGGNDGENENNPLRDLMTDPLSTNYRLEMTSIQDIMRRRNEDSDEKGSLEFDCPNCGGKHKREPHTLMENCPTNGKPIPKC